MEFEMDFQNAVAPLIAAPIKQNLNNLTDTGQASMVSHPPHYNAGKIEVIEFIEDQALGFHRGNAVKYIARAGKKLPDRVSVESYISKEIEDLEKAVWYLRREIECVKARAEKRAPIRPNDMK
jgi:hypothetical protein